MTVGPVFQGVATALRESGVGPTFQGEADALRGFGVGPVYSGIADLLPPAPGRTTGGGPPFGTVAFFTPAPTDPDTLPRVTLGDPNEFDPPQQKIPFGEFKPSGTGSGLSPGTLPREAEGFGAEEQ